MSTGPKRRPAAARATTGGAKAKPAVRRRAARVIAHPDYATVERTIAAQNDELLARYGAHHLGVSKKYRKGKRLPDTCITFYVKRKGKKVRAPQIPKTLALVYEGGSRRRRIATDVCAIGQREPRAFLLRGGNLIIAGDGETGTVGLIFSASGADFFLTNAHVATDPGAPPDMLRVQSATGAVALGRVTRMDDLTAPVIRSDAALVAVQANSVLPQQFNGTPLQLAGCGDIAINDPRQFFYVAGNVVHALRWRAFMPSAAPIVVDGLSLRYAGFHKLDVTAGQCRPGHSGAVVFCQSASGPIAVGLLFGGIQSTNEVWVFPVRLCLQQMGVNPDAI